MKKKYFYFVLLGIMLLIIAACEPTMLNTPPTAPSNPEPSNGASGVSVKPLLNWSLSLDSDGDSVKYDLYFGTTQTNLSLRASDLTANFYMFTESLDEGIPYYWKVVSKDGKGGQTEGPVWSFTTEEKPTNTAPTAPSNPNPTNGAIGVPVDVTLSWQASDPDGDALKFDLYLGTAFDLIIESGAGGVHRPLKDRDLTTKSYKPEGLEYGTTYYWRVVAKDGKGGETSGDEWKFTTEATPNAPSNLSAQVLSTTEIKLTWTDNSDNETGFKIERKTEGIEWSQIKTVGANIKEYTDSGLNPNTTYYYRVRAYNSAGNSSYSNEANAKTHVLVQVPNAPSNLSAQALSTTEIKLTWTDNSDNETGFKIERRLGTSGSWSQIDTVGANIKEYIDSGLSPNTTYYYRVRAYNSAGDSSYSNEEQATTQAPKEVGHYDTPDSAFDVYVKDDYAYVADLYNGLVVVDVSDPTDPKEGGHCDIADSAEDVYVKGDYAYVADYKNGLVVVDVSNSTDPKEEGYFDIASSAEDVYVEDVYVEGDYAYVAAGNLGLVIIDVSNPTNPYEVGQYYIIPMWAGGVYVKDNYAYVAGGNTGLVIVDISDPINPQRAGQRYTVGYAKGVYVKDNYAYVADWEGGLVIIDVSNPTNPQKVWQCDTAGYAAGVYVKDNYAYVADGGGLVIVDVSCF